MRNSKSDPPVNLLGCKIRDVVTGFTGVAVTLADHLTGCRRYWVEGPVNDKGETQERWIDDGRIEVVEYDAVRLAEGPGLLGKDGPADCGHPRS